MQEDMRALRERLAAAEAEVADSSDALRLTKEDAAAELAENNAALAAASAELQELRDVHHDVSLSQHDHCHAAAAIQASIYLFPAIWACMRCDCACHPEQPTGNSQCNTCLSTQTHHKMGHTQAAVIKDKSHLVDLSTVVWHPGSVHAKASIFTCLCCDHCPCHLVIRLLTCVPADPCPATSSNRLQGQGGGHEVGTTPGGRAPQEGLQSDPGA